MIAQRVKYHFASNMNALAEKANGEVSYLTTRSDGNYTFDTAGNVSGLGSISGGAVSGSSTLHIVGASTFGSTIATTGSVTVGDNLSLNSDAF